MAEPTKEDAVQADEIWSCIWDQGRAKATAVIAQALADRGYWSARKGGLAEPTEQDREKARKLLEPFVMGAPGHLGEHARAAVVIAQALADERQARDEHWAKWHEEQKDYWSAAFAAAKEKDDAKWIRGGRMMAHLDSASAIRAKGEVK